MNELDKFSCKLLNHAMDLISVFITEFDNTCYLSFRWRGKALKIFSIFRNVANYIEEK